MNFIQFQFINKSLFALVIGLAFLIISPTVSEASALTKAPNNLGLVGYWNFEDGKLSKATDFSGKGNTGTLTNMDAATDWVSGKAGKALDFDGADDYLQISDSATVSPTAAITVSQWIYPTTAGSAGGDLGPIWKGNVASGVDQSYGFLWLASRIISFRIGSASGIDSIDAVGALPLNTWTHVVGVYTGTTKLIYINGVLSDSSATSITALKDTSQDLYIGGTFAVSNYRYFTGRVDETRIYSRALSATEVAALYAQSSGSLVKNSSRGLVAHWTFEEGAGTTTADKTGNGNTGTLTNSPTWTNGKFGKGLNFNGSFVSASPPITATATFSTWATWDGSQARMLFGIGSGSPGPDVFFYNGKISWNSYDSDGNSFGAIPANANDGNWHHYVFVIDPGNTKLYYDGSLYGTATYVSAASGSLQIGGQSIYLWSGKIDDFRIYNRALSAQEVSNLYNSSGEALGILNRAHRDTLTSGLVGYWSFDGSQMSGNTATDGSGSGNSGTLTGGPTKTIGVLGQGVKFDGSDDYVTMGDAVALNGTQSRTISTWVKFSSDPLTTAQWLVERGNATNATYWLWWNGDNSFSLGDNTLVCGHRIANGTGEQIANTWTPVANMWYHVSCVYDGSQLIEYVNGVLLGSAGSATGSVTDETSSARTLQLGRRIATGGSNLNGILDDVRIYNRAISASEVSKLFISTGGRGSDVPYVVPADATAPVISNVQDTIGTHCVTATQTVSWATNEASNSQVEYGLTASYGTTTTLDSSLVTQHAVSISGLTLNTLYYYRVRSADAAGNVAYSASTMTTPGSLCGPD